MYRASYFYRWEKCQSIKVIEIKNKEKEKIRKLNFVYHELAPDSWRVFLHFYTFRHRLEEVGKLGFSIVHRIYRKRLTNDS